MKKISLINVFLLTACVTVNIYFPAKAADKVADEIIKGIQDKQAVQPGPVSMRQPENDVNWTVALLQFVDGALQLVISQAQADEADLSVDTAEIRNLRASMKNRFAALQGFYAQGYVGIKADGFLAVKDAGNVPLKDRNRVNKLVAAENTDRQQLYQAIANANGHPDWAGDIQATFAKRWVSNAQAGWFYQQADGSWQNK